MVPTERFARAFSSGSIPHDFDRCHDERLGLAEKPLAAKVKPIEAAMHAGLGVRGNLLLAAHEVCQQLELERIRILEVA